MPCREFAAVPLRVRTAHRAMCGTELPSQGQPVGSRTARADSACGRE